MKKIIYFYLKQLIPLLTVIFGVYLIFNTLTITFGSFFNIRIYRGVFLTGFIMAVFLLIYLIQFIQLDTGKEKFTIVSMTDQSYTSIMVSKIIVSYIVIITFIIIQALFMSIIFSLIPREYGNPNLFNFLFYGSLRILALFTVIISYIANPMIWARAFSNSKLFRRFSFIGIIIIWFISNRIIQRVFFDTLEISHRTAGRFGEHQFMPIMLIWNLIWSVLFFAITLYLQKRKIDSL